MHAWRIIYALCFLITFTSCRYHEAKEVIATADSLDQSEHVVYDDTAALGRTIRCLDNPFGRLFMRSTLGKAYYYMGRNLEDTYQQILEAADCYIKADRLQITDPIYQGRVNSCMGYICAQNNNDSLALIFYERASEDFKESRNEWRYAQMLLTIAHHRINLHQFLIVDSLLQVAQTYPLGSAYHARYYETGGLYHYEQLQYDSALVYLQRGLEYWQTEEDKCFSYLKMLQIYLDIDALDKALLFAQYIVEESNNPNYLINAYYCLMQDAKRKNNAQLLSLYSHARTDVELLLRDKTNKYAEATPKLMEHLQNPRPLRWIWITLSVVVTICIFLVIGIWGYRKRSQAQEKDLLHQQSLLEFEKGLTEIMDKYHSPRKHWRNYANLKKDIAPWIRNWTAKLDTLPLSEQEKIFCTISLIYPNLSDIEIANYMCYAKGTIRVFKSRILRKIGIPSSEYTNFLHNISNYK